MTDIATISLRVNTDEVERGSKALDDFGRTAQDTAKKTDDLNRVFKTGPQAVKPASASIAEQRQELQKLLDKISPVNRALNQLDEMQEKLAKAHKAGILPTDDYTHYNDLLEKNRQKIAAAGEETKQLGLKSAGARREIGVLIGELARGNLGALRGSGITLANRAGWIEQLMTLRGLGIAGVVGGITAAVYALGKAWYQGSQESVEFSKQLILTGNYAGQTAASLSAMAKAISGNGVTQHAAAGVLAQVTGSGKFNGKELEQVAKTAAMMQETVGQSVDATIKDFEKLKDAPTKASEELNSRLHYLTAAQYQYISALEAKGDKDAAAAAAEKAYSEAMQQRMNAVHENMGLIERAAAGVARTAKSMRDALMDIGRVSSSQSQLEAAEKELAQIQENVKSGVTLKFGDTSEADMARLKERIRNLKFAISSEKGYTDARNARRAAEEQGIRDQARANQLMQEGMTRARQRAKATQELNAAIERNHQLARQTASLPKDQQVREWTPGQIAKMRAGIANQYKDPKTPKTPAIQVDAGDRANETAQRQLLNLQAQLKTLKDQYSTGEAYSQQRKDLQDTENQIAILQQAAQHRQLTAQEQSLLASSKQTLEYKRQSAGVGDQIEKQKKLNELHQRATKFIEQQKAKQAEIAAQAAGMTDKQAGRAATEDRIKSVYGDGEDGKKVLESQRKTWDEADALQSNWQAGAKKAYGQWVEDSSNSYQQVYDLAQNTFNGMTTVLTDFFTTGKANFKDFLTEFLKGLAQLLVKMEEVQAMKALIGDGDKDTGLLGKLAGYASGGYTGDGGKYDPKGVVHGGEFVFTKEATSRIGVGNLYAMMQGKPGYADGGYVGKAQIAGLRSGNGGSVNVDIGGIVIQGGQQQSENANSSSSVDIMKQLKPAIVSVVSEQAQRPGTPLWNAIKGKR